MGANLFVIGGVVWYLWFKNFEWDSLQFNYVQAIECVYNYFEFGLL